MQENGEERLCARDELYKITGNEECADCGAIGMLYFMVEYLKKKFFLSFPRFHEDISEFYYEDISMSFILIFKG